MSATLNTNKQMQSSEKYMEQNSQNFNNNDSNRMVYNMLPRATILSRKTSKRRQAQEQKAGVLDLFKELLSVVNQKFINAYQSPPKPKLPKIPKMQKNQSKMSKKQSQQHSATKAKKQEAALINHAGLYNNFPASSKHPISPVLAPHTKQKSHSYIEQQQKRQKQSHSHYATHSNNNVSNHNNNHSSHQQGRKYSQSCTHKQRTLNQKNQLLKEHLKREILENYSVLMKYVVREEEMEDINQYDQMMNGQQESKRVKSENSNKEQFDFLQSKKELNKRSSGSNQYEIKPEKSSDREPERKHSGLISKHNQEMNEEPYENELELLSQENQVYEQKILKKISKQPQLQNQGIGMDIEEDQSSSSEQQQQKEAPVGAFHQPRHSEVPHAHTTQQFISENHPIVDQNVEQELHRRHLQDQYEQKQQEKQIHQTK